jgi:prolyl-tRNA synthetase
VNDVKLYNVLSGYAAEYDATKVLGLRVPDAEAQAKWAAQPLPLGYIAPDLGDDYIQGSDKVASQFLRLADRTVTELNHFVTGSNESGFHVVGANWGSEFTLPDRVVDVRLAQAGDRAVHDPSQTLDTARGIEAGHIFQLGTKYSAAMGATFTNEDGEELPMFMGCYGVGVSRIAQAAVEQSHDANGIIWPVEIAPYHAIVVVPNVKDAQQMAVAETLYHDLNAAGVETLLDDRPERAGVKFKDAELIGIPYRIVTGRAIAKGLVELVERATGTTTEVSITQIVEQLRGAIVA